METKLKCPFCGNWFTVNLDEFGNGIGYCEKCKDYIYVFNFRKRLRKVPFPLIAKTIYDGQIWIAKFEAKDVDRLSGATIINGDVYYAKNYRVLIYPFFRIARLYVDGELVAVVKAEPITKYGKFVQIE
jgi:hypothetical protein